MTDNKTCETCRFSSKFAKVVSTYYNGDYETFPYECRIRSVSLFPLRKADDWCGEWKDEDEPATDRQACQCTISRPAEIRGGITYCGECSKPVEQLSWTEP